jgi:hypothetical protein
MNASSAAVTGGAELPRSRAHLVYIGLELLKAVGLIALGVVALAAA